MSEFLLSSVSVKELNPSVVSSSAKGSGEILKTGVGLSVSRADGSVQPGNAFNKILSSVTSQSAVNQSNFKNPEGHLGEELFAAINELVVELEQVMPDSEALTEIRDMLKGQDMSTLGSETDIDGVSLPEFLSQLEAMISSELNKVDGNSGVSISESLDEDALASLGAAFSQLNSVLSEIAKKSGEPLPASPDTLLGFSFTGGKGKDGKWQQYDPQQMSQSESQKVSQSEPQKVMLSETQKAAQSEGQRALQTDTKNLQHQNFAAEHLVSESDKSFKSQMQQLAPDVMTDNAELVESLINTRADAPEKPALKFADLQLRGLNDGLKQYSTTLSTPVQSQQWGEEVSQKVVWFTGRNIQAAEMHLNPAELGPIDVKINIQNDVASVTFNVHNASVRDLLESNVVRLREMMEASGVNVGDVNVDSGDREHSQQSGSESEQKGFGQSGQDTGENSELSMEEQVIEIKQTNLVDYFV